MLPTNRKQEVTQSCATVGVAEIPRSPPTSSGGGRQDEKEKYTKDRQSCAAIEWPDPPDHNPVLSGGV